MLGGIKLDANLSVKIEGFAVSALNLGWYNTILANLRCALRTIDLLSLVDYKTRADVLDFVACCAGTEESCFNGLVQQVRGDKRLQPFTQHIQEEHQLGQNEWFFGMDHEYVEDLTDFMWFIMNVGAKAGRESSH